MIELSVSSTSIDENTGTARIVIDGTLPVMSGCDDPIVELFRPIRAKRKDEMLFIITVARTRERIDCSIYASNRRGRPTNEFLKVATRLLKGNEGIVADYSAMLKLFFSEESGLATFIENANKGNFEKCNKSIKMFVAKMGYKMPSRKKEKKTRAQKRASSQEYLAQHPEKDKSKKS